MLYNGKIQNDFLTQTFLETGNSQKIDFTVQFHTHCVGGHTREPTICYQLLKNSFPQYAPFRFSLPVLIFFDSSIANLFFFNVCTCL